MRKSLARPVRRDRCGRMRPHRKGAAWDRPPGASLRPIPTSGWRYSLTGLWLQIPSFSTQVYLGFPSSLWTAVSVTSSP